jgi:hypothetical protein
LLRPVDVDNIGAFSDNYSSPATRVNVNDASAYDHNTTPDGPASLWARDECSTSLVLGSAYPAIPESDVLPAVSPADGLPFGQQDRPFGGSEHGSMHVSRSSDYHVSPGQSFSNGGLQIYTDRIPMPFEDQQQALLFKHYIDTLSSLVSAESPSHDFIIVGMPLTHLFSLTLRISRSTSQSTFPSEHYAVLSC